MYNGSVICMISKVRLDARQTAAVIVCTWRRLGCSIVLCAHGIMQRNAFPERCQEACFQRLLLSPSLILSPAAREQCWKFRIERGNAISILKRAEQFSIFIQTTVTLVFYGKLYHNMKRGLLSPTSIHSVLPFNFKCNVYLYIGPQVARNDRDVA